MKTVLHTSLPALVLAGLLAAGPAQAQYIMEFSQAANAPMSNFIIGTASNNLAMINAATPNAAGAAPAAPMLANGAPAVQRNAQELARVFPEAQRPQVSQAFAQSMDFYQKLEAKMGWPRNELGGAMAAFIVGNYMVFSGAEVPDEQFAAVAQQMRGNAGMRATFQQQGAQAVRNLYEQCAMVGTFMALAHKSLQQNPQPRQQANLRATARENLKLVLGADPERLRLGAQGLSLQ